MNKGNKRREKRKEGENKTRTREEEKNSEPSKNRNITALTVGEQKKAQRCMTRAVCVCSCPTAHSPTAATAATAAIAATAATAAMGEKMTRSSRDGSGARVRVEVSTAGASENFLSLTPLAIVYGTLLWF